LSSAALAKADQFLADATTFHKVSEITLKHRATRASSGKARLLKTQIRIKENDNPDNESSKE
jgi:hypothetical protein